MNMGADLGAVTFVFMWLAFSLTGVEDTAKLAWYDTELHCIAFGSCIEQGVYMNGWLAV